MDAAFVKSMLENGIVSGLFIITFVTAIYKGIPAALKAGRETLEKLQAEHTHQVTLIINSHEKTINATTDKFVNQMDQLRGFHEDHKKCHEDQ